MLKKILLIIGKIKWWWADRRYKGLFDNDDGIEYCQDCGCMLDWDMEDPGDDIIRPGYVTASGDIFCSRCGREYDEEEERRAEEDADWYPDPQDWDELPWNDEE